jgi:nicotinamide mononucleotide transporter
MAAVAAGLLCVWLTTRQNVWCWPIGLVQVVLFIYVFWQAKLYSDVLLHVVYVGLQLWGWHQWLYGSREQQPLHVARLTALGAAVCIGIGIVGTASLGGAMAAFTDASLPYWDAAIAAFSLVAQFLLARKLLENWLFWMFVDVLGVGVYSAKGLYPTAGLYAIFFLLCVIGWLSWKKELRSHQPG